MYDNHNHSNCLISIIERGKEKLSKANISNAHKEIEWFLQSKLSIPLHSIKTNQSYKLNNTKIKLFSKFINRRITGEPFQYIIKQAPFYGYDFIVNSDTLIPRPESETIIRVAKKYGKFNQALDLGTGTGNLAITLSLQKIAKNIDAIDISSKALKVANRNKKKHKTLNVHFFKKDIFHLRAKKGYDLIISNPPYISQREYLKLDQHILDYEPQISLTDNNEGLDFYKFFSKNLIKNLNPKGKIILEIGYKKNHKTIKNLFVKNNFKHKWHKDLNGDNRVIELYQ